MMNCLELFESIGFTCQEMPADDGKPVYAICTPFEYSDGDGIHLFVEEIGDQLRFFDAGDTLFQIAPLGSDFSGEQELSLQKLVDDAGAHIDEDGEISTLVASANAPDGFRKVLTAILNLATWEAKDYSPTLGSL